MNYKIIILCFLILFNLGCFSVQKYYSDDLGEIHFTERNEDIFYLSIDYPSYAVKDSSRIHPGNEKYFKFLEEKYSYQILVGTKKQYKIEAFKVTIVDENNNIISEDGAMVYKDQINIYSSLDEVISKNQVNDLIIHVFFNKEKLSEVKSIIMKCIIVLKREKEIKQFEFSKKLNSKTKIITPLYFYH